MAKPKSDGTPFAMSVQESPPFSLLYSPQWFCKNIRSGFDGMTHNLVDTLAPFRKTLVRRQKLRAHALVSRLPVFAAVIRAINAAGGDCDVHALRV